MPVAVLALSGPGRLPPCEQHVFGTGPSIQLVRLFGIRIGASPSWFIVLFVFIYLLSGSFTERLDGSTTDGYLLAVAAALLFFVSLVAHELGHALTARRLGIGISGIDLWFFGGVAKMTRDTDSPGAEFKVSAAGPVVTLLVVLACLAVGSLVSGTGDFTQVVLFESAVESTPLLMLLGFLASINALLLVFNLVPAFPLDGGRLARAAVWRVTGDRGKATRVAGRMGQGFGYLLIGLALYIALATDAVLNAVWFAVLGYLLATAARSAVVSTAFTEHLDGITVEDIMDREPVTMPAATPALQAQEEFFERYGWDFFAVTDAEGRFVGIARHAAVQAAVAEGRPALAVSELVAGDEEGWRVPADQPIEALLGDPGLREHGALMAVDGAGVLRGVVTLEQVRRAVAAALPQRVA
jgi:Zn-dependent protease/CBS domain-containing protein